MALGATRGRILAWILSYVMTWSAVGLALGAAGAFVAVRQFRSMLYEVTAADPWTFGLVVTMLGTVSTIAALSLLAAPPRSILRRPCGRSDASTAPLVKLGSRLRM
jgi:hypothetical protein